MNNKLKSKTYCKRCRNNKQMIYLNLIKKLKITNNKMKKFYKAIKMIIKKK